MRDRAAILVAQATVQTFVMADGPMVALRRAWFGNDGPAMVAAVETGGLAACLQWAGDLVRAAVQLAAPGLRPAARPAVAE